MRVSILIVDDHVGVRAGIRLLLAQEPGWVVCGEAVNGIDAIAKSRELMPDVILMDISMPELDGLSATRVIKSERPQIRVLVVSQNDPGNSRLLLREVGAEGFVGKSNLPRDLIPELKRILSQNRESETASTSEGL